MSTGSAEDPFKPNHVLKTWPRFFAAVASGAKTFEVRVNDRDFKVGDLLRLDEWDPESGDYTRNVCYRVVSYVMPGGSCFGIDANYVVLGLHKMKPGA